MDEFMKIHPDLAPAEGEVTVVKRRVSAFTGNDLEVLLRSFNIKHLVLTGIATSGVDYPPCARRPTKIIQ